MGSAAVLLARPEIGHIETVNDADGFISNFFRAVAAEPDAVAYYADWPVNENDLHARHAWLVGQRDSLQARLEGDPDYYDAKVAGWWCWGMCCWIGGNFCSGDGPWQIVDGQLVKVNSGTGSGVVRSPVQIAGTGRGVHRKRVHLTHTGSGVNRSRVHLSDAGCGVNRKRVHLTNAGCGVNRKRVHLADAENQVETDVYIEPSPGVYDWMHRLARRLRQVRVCCGDWTRVVTPCVTTGQGLTGVFLDPPYSAEAGRDNHLYRVEDTSIAHAVREWCIANGDNPLFRICLAGYEGEHDMPAGWTMYRWVAAGGYASQGNKNKDNRYKERLWFSPHCLTQPTLFDYLKEENQ